VRLRALHYMKCPKCGHDMHEENLEAVHVDRCTSCQGVYFDAGELDRIVLQREKRGKGFFRRLLAV
jgi:uncharacterized protein